MKKQFFLSYRRADPAVHGIVGRVQDRLVARFGEGSVFLDQDSIPAGTDFRKTIVERVKNSSAVLLFIGPEWNTILEEKSSSGNDEDFLLDEIRTALEHNIKLIPVLVNGAQIPSPTDLPEDLKTLPYLEARNLSLGRDFNAHMKALMNDLAGDKGKSRRQLLVGVGAAGAAALAGSGLYATGNMFAGKEPAIIPVAPPKYAKDTVSFKVIMGENVFYEREIAKGFEDEIKTLLAPHGVKVVFRDTSVPNFKGTNYASWDSDQGRQTWSDVVSQIRNTYSPGDIDFFVTLGTYASQAIKYSGLLEDLKCSGLIYLGVTDPSTAGLKGQDKIAGIQYGPGGYAYGQKLNEIFEPRQKLIFIYQNLEGNIQDKSVAENFTRLNYELSHNAIYRSPRFEIQAVDGVIEIPTLTPADLSDPLNSAFYIGWYGLDNILSHENATPLYEPTLWIVPSTYSEANLRAAGVIVSVEDRMVGRMGAQLIDDYMRDPTLPLSEYPVRSPAFKVWADRKRLKEKGIIIPQHILNHPNDDHFEII